MRRFLEIATRLSIVFAWCDQLLRQFASLMVSLRIAILSVVAPITALMFLVVVIKALLACYSRRRRYIVPAAIFI